MGFERFVAARYLRSRRRQVFVSLVSLISVLGIMTGVAALIIILALYAGMTQDLQQKILGATAHLTVASASGQPLRPDDVYVQRLQRHPGVVTVSPVVLLQAMLNRGTAAVGVVLKGISPSVESQVLKGHMRFSGTGLDHLGEGRQLILGKQLSGRLGIQAGDWVGLVIPQGELSPFGIQPRFANFQVVGIFESGLYDVDAAWGFIHIQQARALREMPDDSVQMLELRLNQVDDVTRIETEILRELGSGITTTNWMEMNKPLFSALKLEKWGMFLAIGLIMIVAALNIVTSLVLMVMEKGRDIGILRAMGCRRGQIMGIFIYQGVATGLVGTILGCILGVTLSLACDRYQWIHLDASVYSIAYLPFVVKVFDVVIVAAAAMLICLIATLYPSRRAAAIDPVEAIRYE